MMFRHRAAMVGAGGISALVSALQDGSSRAKAAASRLLLGFAAEGPESQEWIAAAPGAVDGLVDLLRCALHSSQAASTFRHLVLHCGSSAVRLLNSEASYGTKLAVLVALRSRESKTLCLQ